MESPHYPAPSPFLLPQISRGLREIRADKWDSAWLWGAASEKKRHGHIQGPHGEAKEVLAVLLFVYIPPEDSKLTLSDMFLISQW